VLRLSAFCIIFFSVNFSSAIAGSGQVNVTTQHNDNFRSGQNVRETILAPANVNASSFGKLFSQAVDGQVYAQPLYLSQVTIPGLGIHNVVYVATENDSVYAFDADDIQGSNAGPLWKTAFADAANGVSPVPSRDEGCTDLVPKIGITGTPVIDSASGTLYVVANTKEKGSYVQRLHALDVATGQEKFGGPVVIQASQNGETFNAQLENQRAGLLLQSGVVYIGWASHCDYGPYTGWIMSYGAATLRQLSAFNTTLNYDLGGVWNAGSGLAADTQGNVFVATGNGTFSVTKGLEEYADSILRLAPVNGKLKVLDFFAPDNQAYLAQYDLDLGSGGVMLLPAQPGNHPDLLVESGKEGTVYLIDRTHMGQYDQSANRNLQTLYFAVGGMWSVPAYWNKWIYFWGSYDVPKAFALVAGKLTASPVSSGAANISYPSATPSISANGGTAGLLWAVQSDAYTSGGPAVLHAFDATNLASELYNSSQNLARDDPGPAVKFAVPTVANGKVYVGTGTQLSVYGLLQESSK
jgi:hypothetical protein